MQALDFAQGGAACRVAAYEFRGVGLDGGDRFAGGVVVPQVALLAGGKVAPDGALRVQQGVAQVHQRVARSVGGGDGPVGLLDVAFRPVNGEQGGKQGGHRHHQHHDALGPRGHPQTGQQSNADCLAAWACGKLILLCVRTGFAAAVG